MNISLLQGRRKQALGRKQFDQVSRSHGPAPWRRPNLWVGRRPLRLELLEDRTVPATFQVNSTSDLASGSGDAGDLRYCIDRANDEINFPGEDTITFDTSVFGTDKTITLGGVELFVTAPLTITGPAAKVTIDAASGDRIFDLLIPGAGSGLTVSNMTLINGNATGPGGAVYAHDDDFSMTNGAILNCKASGPGGAIGNQYSDGGVWTFVNSTISGNIADDNGGGIYFFSYGNLVMSGSAVTGNTAKYSGGGIYNFSATAIIQNSTISSNKASKGGGVYAYYGDNVTIQNCTIAFNSAKAHGGGILEAHGAVTMDSTIVARNSAPSGPDCKGAVSANESLFGTAAGATINGSNNQLNTDPLLSPLSDHGGPTQTYGLQAGSPALDKGSNPAGLLFDQRGTGHPRQVGAAVDIGAFEGVLTNPAATLTPISPITTAGATPNTVQVTYSDDTAIDVSSIDVSDITVTGPSGNLPVTAVKVDVAANGSPRVATYTFVVPGGSWGTSVNGKYTIAMNAGQVFDTDGPNTVAASTLDTFQVAIPITYMVDEVSDVEDGNHTPNHLSIREAINLANTDGALSAITFSTSVFSSAKTILMAGGQMKITAPVPITGPAAKLTLDAGSLSRIFDIDVPGSDNNPVSISNLALTNGAATGDDGGGILNNSEAVSLTRVSVTNCTTDEQGGGIGSTYGSLSLIDCTISSNSATRGGGIGIYYDTDVSLVDTTISGNSSSEAGGGLYFFYGGSLNVTGSTISGNTSDTVVASGGGGGGMFLFYTTTTIVDSTISGNSTVVEGDGGGIFNFGGDVYLTIRNSTIAFNHSAEDGGGIEFGAMIASSIVADNTAGGTGPDVSGPVIATYSLFGDSTNVFIQGAGVGVLLDVDPLLDTLGNNGGPTQTHALLPGSPAIDAGSNPEGLTVDQRGPGFSRTSGSSTDIGAFEDQPVPPPTVTGVEINGGAPQRSRVTTVKVSFSQHVTLSATPASAFQLNRVSDNAIVNLAASVDDSGTGTAVTLTFTGGAVDANSLADGRYTLAVRASQINGPGGKLDGNGDGAGGDDFAMVGTPANGLFRLFGDADGNGAVEMLDFAAFQMDFGSGSDVFDSDGDGDVDVLDFSRFRVHFGSFVP